MIKEDSPQAELDKVFATNPKLLAGVIAARPPDVPRFPSGIARDRLTAAREAFDFEYAMSDHGGAYLDAAIKDGRWAELKAAEQAAEQEKKLAEQAAQKERDLVALNERLNQQDADYERARDDAERRRLASVIDDQKSGKAR